MVFSTPGTKAGSEGTLVRPNQVNNQVNNQVSFDFIASKAINVQLEWRLRHLNFSSWKLIQSGVSGNFCR